MHAGDEVGFRTSMDVIHSVSWDRYPIPILGMRARSCGDSQGWRGGEGINAGRYIAGDKSPSHSITRY